MIRQLTAREKKIFIVTLAAVAVSVFYNALLQPLYERKEFLTQEIEIHRQQLQRDLRAVQKVEALDAKYDAYLKQFRQLGTEEEVSSSILSEIEGVAGRFGLHVTDLKPQRVEHDKYGNQFAVSLTINSELTDVIRFLCALQQSPYLFNVERMEFEKFERRNQSKLTTRLVLGKAFISSGAGQQAVEEKTGRGRTMAFLYDDREDR